MKSDNGKNNQRDPLADIISDFYEFDSALDHMEAGRVDEAAKILSQMPDVGSQDQIGTNIHLASIGKIDAPDVMPEAYVRTLFKQMSATYDVKLLDTLRYTLPEKVREKIRELQLGPFERMLDLGCGTGLCCEVLKDQVAHKTGLDLCAQMVEKARGKEIYDHLLVSEINRFLKHNTHENWDLIVSTDVIPYIGALEDLFKEVSQNMIPEGIFLFSTEAQPEETFDGHPYVVGKYCRYAHSKAYLCRLLKQNNMKLLDLTQVTLRQDNDGPVPGNLMVARKMKA